MDKINFQNLPNTTTPINATNMNLLQTNVENALPTSNSSTNGSWLIIGDIAICWYSYTKNTPVSSAWGSGFSSGEFSLPDFPITFAEIPKVFKSLDNGGYAGVVMSANSNPATIVNPGNVQIYRGTSATAVDYIINVLAIGKYNNGGISI